MVTLVGGATKTSGGSGLTAGGTGGGTVGGAISSGVASALSLAQPVAQAFLQPQNPYIAPELQGYVAQTVPIAPSQTYYGGATNTAVNNNATQNTTNSQQNIYNESTYAPYENKAYGALNFIQSGEQPKMPLGQLAAYQPSQVIAQAIQPQAPYQSGGAGQTATDASGYQFAPSGLAQERRTAGGDQQFDQSPMPTQIPVSDGSPQGQIFQGNAINDAMQGRYAQVAKDQGNVRQQLGAPPPDYQKLYQQYYQQALAGMNPYARNTPQGRAQAMQAANIQVKNIADGYQIQQQNARQIHSDYTTERDNIMTNQVDMYGKTNEAIGKQQSAQMAQAKEINDLKKELRQTPLDENGGNSARMSIAMTLAQSAYPGLDPYALQAIAGKIEKDNPVNPEVAERTKKLISDRKVAEGTVNNRIATGQARATIAQVTAKYAQPMAALGLDIKKLDKDIKAIAAKYGEAKAKAQLQHLATIAQVTARYAQPMAALGLDIKQLDKEIKGIAAKYGEAKAKAALQHMATQDKYLNNSIARGYFADYMRAREAEGKELERADMAGIDQMKDKQGKPIPGTVDPNSAGAPFLKRAGEFKNMADGMQGAATGGNARPTRVSRSAAPAQLTAGQQNIIGQLKDYFPNNGLSQAMNELGYTDTVKAGQYLEQLWNNTGGNAVAVARAIEIARRARM